MPRLEKPFYGRTFVGDTSKNLVHSQLYEKTECQIDSIAENCIRTFSPDTLDQAKSEGYMPCKYCLRFEVPFSSL
jgi:hypothetical protein